MALSTNTLWILKKCDSKQALEFGHILEEAILEASTQLF